MFQEYDFEVVVKHGCLNAGPDHLSHIETGEEPTSMEEELPDAQLFAMMRYCEGMYPNLNEFISSQTRMGALQEDIMQGE